MKAIQIGAGVGLAEYRIEPAAGQLAEHERLDDRPLGRVLDECTVALAQLGESPAIRTPVGRVAGRPDDRGAQACVRQQITIVTHMGAANLPAVVGVVVELARERGIRENRHGANVVITAGDTYLVLIVRGRERNAGRRVAPPRRIDPHESPRRRDG